MLFPVSTPDEVLALRDLTLIDVQWPEDSRPRQFVVCRRFGMIYLEHAGSRHLVKKIDPDHPPMMWRAHCVRPQTGLPFRIDVPWASTVCLTWADYLETVIAKTRWLITRGSIPTAQGTIDALAIREVIDSQSPDLLARFRDLAISHQDAYPPLSAAQLVAMAKTAL